MYAVIPEFGIQERYLHWVATCLENILLQIWCSHLEQEILN